MLVAVSFAAALVSVAVSAGPLTPTRGALPWNDWNFIQTTDLHGYVGGHGIQDGGKYSANVADVAVFVDEMRLIADKKNAELFVIDSGDWHDGTAYGDKTNPVGKLTDPLLSQIDYDVISIGNHEMYINATVNQVYNNVVPRFPERFLTGNVQYIKPDGSVVDFSQRVRKFKGSKGSKVTAFGFVYSDFMKQPPAANSIETKVTDEVNKPWFTEAIQDKPDFFLLVGHIALRATSGTTDKNVAPDWAAVIKSIRAVHATVPIVVFGGHYHIRDFMFMGENVYGLTSGRYLETLGFLSLNKNGEKSSVDRRYLDVNVNTLNYHLGHDENFALGSSTEKGKKMNQAIIEAGIITNASQVIGYAPHDYYLSRVPATNEYSAAYLWESMVYKTYQKPAPANPAYFVSNRGTLRSDIFGGPFTVNDAFMALPFANKVLVVENVDFTVIAGFKAWFNKFNKHTKRATCKGTPGLVTVDDLSPISDGEDTAHCPYDNFSNPAKGLYSPIELPANSTQKWDLVFCDYVAPDVVDALASFGVTAKLGSIPEYIPGKYSNDFLVDMAKKFWQKDSNSTSTSTASAATSTVATSSSTAASSAATSSTAASSAATSSSPAATSASTGTVSASTGTVSASTGTVSASASTATSASASVAPSADPTSAAASTSIPVYIAPQPASSSVAPKVTNLYKSSSPATAVVSMLAAVVAVACML
ncbi:hypothetical protein HDU77_006002 [Chytriomyces hyalinus]|nr:hypothetical protein HDU77_006002 [Chytriomyces hyalinus]